MIRDSRKYVLKFLDSAAIHSNVLLVQGARQVGKTYLLRSCLEGKEKTISINLEKEPQTKLAIEATKSFEEFTELLIRRHNFKANAGYTLFIDEAQESAKLGSYVRFMKEEWSNTKSILTGSSMKRLFRGDVRVPVGRVDYLNIQGFSFREYLRMNDCESLLDDAKSSAVISNELHQILLSKFDRFLIVGGLPDAVIAQKNGADFESVLNFITASQCEDFLRIEDVKSYLFIDALKGVSNHVGSAAKFTHIAANNYDAKKIIQKLREWSIVYEIDQQGESPTQNFAPKRYLYDLGVLRFIRESSIPTISLIHTIDERLRTPLGGLMENAILLQLLAGSGGLNFISGWKKNHKEPIEVDFVTKHDGIPLPIEVKATLKANERHCKNIVHYCKLFALKKGVLFSLDNRRVFKCGAVDIEVLPAYLAEVLTSKSL